jgi:hypothetical protein
MKAPHAAQASPATNVPNELIVAAIREILTNDRERDRVVAEGRNLRKRYKTLGVDLEALGITTKNRKRDIDEVVRTMKNTLHYMGLAGQQVSQGALFDGWTTTVSQEVKLGQDIWDAEDSGYMAGRHGVDIAECPYHPPGSELAAAWLSFHKKGRADAQKAQGPDTSTATAPRARRPRQDALPGVPATRHRRNGAGKAPSRRRRNGAGDTATTSGAD